MLVHDFKRDLAFSHALDGAAWWRVVYEHFFGPGITLAAHPANGYGQHRGVDRTVLLPSGRQFWIDEKVRRPECRDRGDILLEYVSNEQRGTPGWVCKPDMFADYVCYVLLSSGRAYLLPVPLLQAAWRQHGEYWKATYAVPPAVNRGYTTRNVAVPAQKLFEAMSASIMFSTGSTPPPARVAPTPPPPADKETIDHGKRPTMQQLRLL